MNICQFLHFNDRCPVCDSPLSLYMSVSKSTLWKAQEISPGTYRFTHTMLKKKIQYTPEDFMMLYDLGAVHSTQFNTSKVGKDSKEWDLFFFKLCNNNALTDHEFDYDINWYESCYYRSSPQYQFKHHPNDPKKWQLEISNGEHKNLLNRDESFAFKKMLPGGEEKVYLLSLDSENKKTKFYSYSTTEDQRKNPDFEPKYFEKDDLPLMKARLDLDLNHRDKLLERFDSWILFS